MIVGILLAAGSSRRFGAPKLLQRLPNGERVGQLAARQLVLAVDRVIAVVRSGDQELARLLQAEGAEVVFFADADQGMGASLATAVQPAQPADAWLIALADMPFIQQQTYCSVVSLLRQGMLIVAPYYQGRRGHPVGFSASLRNELLALNGDLGARAVLLKHQQNVVTAETQDPGVLQDIDRPDDLLTRLLPSYSSGT